MSTERSSSLGLLRTLLPLLYAVLVAACGGGGGDDNGTPAGNVTISGTITFDRVPFKTTVGQGLDFANSIEAPARNVVVEALDASNSSILATTTTDTAGLYSLEVPARRSVIIRAKAQMLKTGTAPTWNFRVLNNTSGDALYTLDSSAFTTSGNATRNLRATSGWGGTSYTGTRAAAPFAILDTVYQVKSLILAAKADTAFPALDLFWSTQNRPSTTLCPDTGDVISSLYISYGTSETDECSTPTLGVSGIYVLGNFQIGDTDEFDQHVIAHESGHYFEDKFSRSDSIGGSHGAGDRLDLRVAFGEGWGNAFGAMALNDSVYRDSFSGASSDSGFNIESSAVTNPGWYSEFSIHKFLWDLFDAANESGDTVALGFAPIYNVMVGAQSSTDALTSIFPFANALKASNAAAATGINTLLAQQGIAPVTDDFANTETVFAGGPNVVPVYTDIASGAPASLCGSAAYDGEYNRISNRRFLRFTSTSSRSINITVTATSGVTPDPDFVVWRRGVEVARSELTGNQESQQVQVGVGTYVIEIYDYNHVDQDTATGTSPTCMTAAVAG